MGERLRCLAARLTPPFRREQEIPGGVGDHNPNAKAKPGVAELTFGFRIDLLKHSNHMPLWVDRKLHTAFPNSRRHRRFNCRATASLTTKRS